MIRTVLIVDDLAIDREILKRILGDGYEVLQAANGEEALAVLAQHKARISAVLLDVIMPVMDGYEVLAAMKKDEVMSQIPVIVESAFSNDKEQEAVITLGANGFISKPYNAVLVRSIVSNAITLREKASIVNSVRYDKLTGLFGREHFFHVADELIQSHEPGYYILASSDIDNFKLINDRYGTAEGDRILRYYANALKDTFEHVEGICGRIAGDNFIVMYANRPDVINYMTEGHGVRYLPQDVVETVRVSVGRYVINDKSLSASAIYDRSLRVRYTIAL